MRRRASKIVRATRFVQLGMAAPLPFVGRDEELTTLCQTVDGTNGRTVLVMRGPAGAGKSRLAQQLVSGTELLGGRAARRGLQPDDHAVAVLARAERAMGVMPGDAMAVLQRGPRLLVIDDLHHLAEAEARQLLQTLVGHPRRPHGPGRVLIISRDMPPLRRDVRPLVLDLGGLTPRPPAALGSPRSDAWSHAPGRVRQRHGPHGSACPGAAPRLRRGRLRRRRLGPRSARRTCAARSRRWPCSRMPAGPAAVAA